jgi:hypothetical protein
MKTIYISYTKLDKDRAEWIALQLEQAGYEVIIDSWDFLAGQNFVLKMHDALQRSDYIL